MINPIDIVAILELKRRGATAGPRKK